MIIVQLLGGMGNQMFQYALAKHLSIKNKTQLKLDVNFLQNRVFIEKFVYRNYDLDIFNVEENFLTNDILPEYNKSYNIKSIFRRVLYYFTIRLKGYYYVREKKFKFDKNILNLKGDIYLDGYWQSPKYFQNIEEAIRKDFTFKKELLPISKVIQNEILKTQSICLNIRRGDFLTDKNIGFVGTDYITNATSKMSELISNPVYFIFSDDIEWCIENIKLNYPVYFVTHEHKGIKFDNYLHLMTLCRHFIIPNSSFGWWAAWLSNNIDKIVIAPKNWLANPKVDTSTILPDNWIKI